MDMANKIWTISPPNKIEGEAMAWVLSTSGRGPAECGRAVYGISKRILSGTKMRRQYER